MERSRKNSFQKPSHLPSPTPSRLSPQAIPTCPLLHLRNRSLRKGTTEASPSHKSAAGWEVRLGAGEVGPPMGSE